MSTILISKQEAIKALTQMGDEIIELQKKQNEVLENYNKLLHKEFGLLEDGKPMTKLDTIKLIQKVLGPGLVR